MIQFAYPTLLVIILAILATAIWFRLKYHKSVTYIYPLTQYLIQQQQKAKFKNWHKKLFFLLRLTILLLLAIIISRPQLTNTRTKLPVEGIDIMIALDVSGSMACVDNLQDPLTRIEVAKQEAKRFISKREHDSIGLVLFGGDAISRLPLTMDKKIISHMIDEIELGIINSQSTVLIKALLLTIKKLQKSNAKSKIIILLTDGMPSPNDINPEIALSMAQKYGIKVYTIAIGNETEAYLPNMWGQMIRVKTSTNKQLLEEIAQKTNGLFFEATKAQDMKKIYDEIDKLEKNEHDTSIYYYQEPYEPLAWSALALSCIEIVTSLIFFGL